MIHSGEVHQTTPFTAEDRYPALFDLAARLSPDARRVLSFGCSTGEELLALRRRFRSAEIIGTEINPRSRRIARRRIIGDSHLSVVPPRGLLGRFDLIFALAVFQREPHKVEEIGLEDISSHYPFARFDAAITELVERLNSGGLLCVSNAQYRVEDSSAVAALQPVEHSPDMEGPLFGPTGAKLDGSTAKTVFRKR